MTRDDIIRMAREAGIIVIGEAIWELCDLVAAAERNACAAMVDPVDKSLADEIRARGEK